jgi:hypothetical protein
MQIYTAYLYLETTLHVSGGTTTHHQERIQLYLQHLVFVRPLLPRAAIAAGSSHGVSVFVCLSVRPPARPPTYLPSHPPIYPPTHLPTYPFNYPPTHLPTYLPTYPPTHLTIHPSLCLSVCLSVCLYISIHPSIHPSFHLNISIYLYLSI